MDGLMPLPHIWSASSLNPLLPREECPQAPRRGLSISRAIQSDTALLISHCCILFLHSGGYYSGLLHSQAAVTLAEVLGCSWGVARVGVAIMISVDRHLE